MASTAVIDADRLTRLLTDLVRFNSINPDLVREAPGERAIAAYVHDYCRTMQLEAEIREVAPGRPNVIARLHGRGLRPPLLLNGHLDTVGVESMTIDPFGAVVRDGRLYGRGAFDMKGGIAAMIEGAVAAAAQGPPPGDVVLTMVADEEFASLGTQAIVRDMQAGSQARAGAAIVTEPTGLDVCVAHKGFTWLTVETEGRAAHGSRYDEGVDAIAQMGRVLVALERLEREVLGKRVVFTDQDSWTTEEIILAYRGQHHVERAFRDMKHPVFLTWRPQFHWTDQKIQVHAFHCVSALIFASLLHRTAMKAGMNVSLQHLLRSLVDIREVYGLARRVKAGERRGRRRADISYTRLNDEQQRLIKLFALDRLQASSYIQAAK